MDLPREVRYLEAYDTFVSRIQALFDMPKSKFDLLWRFLQQNQGKLSKHAKEKEFSQLTDKEEQQIEKVFEEIAGATGLG